MSYHAVKKLFLLLASLKLTVVLFALAMGLIFAGTLAQVHQGIWAVVNAYFRSFVVWIDLDLFVPSDIARPTGRIPFPGGFLVGGLLMINLLAAHAVRFKFSRKRIGVLTIHAGVVLLLVGELMTALFAREGNMSIDEGGSARFTEDIRRVELAVVDRSHPDHDAVVVVPGSMLAQVGAVVRDERLPFTVTVDRWMANSRLIQRSDETGRPGPRAIVGVGRSIVAEPIAKVTGVEAQTVDAPSAYITLSHRGRPLGTWLVSLYVDQPQPVSVDGKTFGISLRFKRTYKPYTLHLIDFRHDKFVGTEKPRNFSSLIRLVDPTRNEDRQVLIYMNHPLRYGGETFYQSAFKPGDTGTILQVVRNPGWLMPYIACALVSLGMLLHFGQNLIRFVRRARA